MKIKQNYDLTELNTFGISAKAKYFVEIFEEKDLKELFCSKEFTDDEKLFLGGGSNVLFTKDFDGIVVLNKLKGISCRPCRVARPSWIRAATSLGIEAFAGGFTS